ncbi:uncharacterized protein BO88DRAFT_419307 [Aspergillus vadensis CBS 113365]|uniref:Uncharacterized protein n=1 Tax=Aspergillus vadensis (strain CBS 113365 / IMI 142717 / IBT 24658) TaxID=1448311 RepID=A0A319BNC1_ASPVC|nr:hypothetical protein BO88DRAFT_419307 [Aspergillus vadensis CBS 113365]PYH64708.1 hypothetical protein BO88DRAFT_419307 [Aspergillus vadensis CBS 113365]
MGLDRSDYRAGMAPASPLQDRYLVLVIRANHNLPSDCSKEQAPSDNWLQRMWDVAKRAILVRIGTRMYSVEIRADTSDHPGAVGLSPPHQPSSRADLIPSSYSVQGFA